MYTLSVYLAASWALSAQAGYGYYDEEACIGSCDCREKLSGAAASRACETLARVEVVSRCLQAAAQPQDRRRRIGCEGGVAGAWKRASFSAFCTDSIRAHRLAQMSGFPSGFRRGRIPFLADASVGREDRG
ncbi:hypothetical protein CCM_00671 [Cordyceps militaris CM01]|uniref:Uncharacterized protein n=1 Tax=Cordyceps militaris (strain CM01) TaxID=983644 RepID=G3J5F5_CORMM|nr:uncharacterized protein CCM_00671 [Cordyceps militaris CM01]EGX96016.1 hypothetical protein CCM_00671 [Cordyceps militaris CM01]